LVLIEGDEVLGFELVEGRDAGKSQLTLDGNRSAARDFDGAGRAWDQLETDRQWTSGLVNNDNEADDRHPTVS
jgi:hypothetical protein